MTFIIILSVTLYLIIGVALGLISKSIDPEDEMTAWEWFWIIVAWLPGLVCVGFEILVEYLKNRKKMKEKPTLIYMLDKKRTLHLADYLVEYGIEVEDVILSQSGRCKIICFDNNDEIQNIIAQFNEDYGKS